METSAATLRAALFIGGFALWGIAEALWPRRARCQPQGSRWRTHLLMGALGALALRWMAVAGVPLAAVAVARWGADHRLGVLNQLEISPTVKLMLSLLVLDGVIWAQHRAFHRWSWLWRWHRVHHADRDLDVSSALRFHPGEILLSMVLKSAVVLALGAPWISVLVFEVVLNGMAMFNHANLHLPGPVDAVMRRVLVTPDLHRIHHSIHRDEQDGNFGFNLSVWDRIAGTFRAAPREGQTQMTLGLAEFQDDAPMRLGWSLRLPVLPVQGDASDGTECR